MITRLTLAEQAMKNEATTQLERVQNLVAYLFEGAPLDLKSPAWDYFIKQFVATYYNREMSMLNVENFRTLLIAELMKYDQVMRGLSAGLFDQILAAGFKLEEVLTRTSQEDRDSNTASTNQQNDVGASKQKYDSTQSETTSSVTDDEGTSTANTVDHVDETVKVEGVSTESNSSTTETEGDGTGKRTNTGTTDRDTTGTETTTHNKTGSVEGATSSTTNASDGQDTTVTTDMYGRNLFSNNPQSIVNASTTGDPDDISWTYATELRDQIDKGTVSTNQTGTNTSTTNGTSETSTVENGTDQLTLDRNEKTTDNRVEDTTNHETSTSNTTGQNNGTNTVDTTHGKDGTSETNTEITAKSTETGSKTGTNSRTNDVDTTATRTGSGSVTGNETLDRLETLNRNWSKLTPYEGNRALYEFILSILQDPVVRVVNAMEPLFMWQFVDEERFIPLTWQEREACAAKL